MKRTLSLILILAMLLSLAACTGKDAAPTDDNAPPQEQGGGEEQPGGTTGTPDEPEQPEQTQPTEQEPTDGKPEQTQPAEQEPAKEPEKEPEKQPEQKPDPKPAETPAEDKPAEQPAETPKPETPAEDKPAAAADDALTILNAIWNTYSDDEKFPAAEDGPIVVDVSETDTLSYLLTFPADDASLIDSAASLVHMMNLNTFTCGAFHVADANNVTRLADDLHTTIQAKHWMCGFPDKLVIVTVGQSVFSVYGNEELVNTFRDKLLASYPTAAAVYDEAINA